MNMWRLLPSVNPTSLAPQGRVSLYPWAAVDWPREVIENWSNRQYINRMAPNLYVDQAGLFAPDARDVVAQPAMRRRYYRIPWIDR